MIPDPFREFDRVARESLRFLVEEKGCSQPTVEYWRDYFLTYKPTHDTRISVGTERGVGSSDWLGVFVTLAYQGEGHVLFTLESALGALEISADLDSQTWPSNIQVQAGILEEHFERIVDHVRAFGVESARKGPDSGTAESGLVLQGADGTSTKSVYIGTGVHFWGSRFLPIDVETFWRIADQGYAPTYAECQCPSCGYSGNVGQRPAGGAAWARYARWLSLLMAILSVAGCTVIDSWRQSDLRLPLTAAAVLVWVLARALEAKLEGFGMGLCPQCGLESREFTLSGPPPTIADPVNPLRTG